MSCSGRSHFSLCSVAFLLSTHLKGRRVQGHGVLAATEEGLRWVSSCALGSTLNPWPLWLLFLKRTMVAFYFEVSLAFYAFLNPFYDFNHVC